MERTDIEVASCRVDMCSCRQRHNYPRGNFSVSFSPHQAGHKGSLEPTFVSRSIAMLNRVRLTYALALFSRFPTHLSQPLRALDIFSRASRPRQTAHLSGSSFSELGSRLQKGSVPLLAPPMLAHGLRCLLPTLYIRNHNPTTGCSKAPRGLHFPLEVSRLCTRM